MTSRKQDSKRFKDSEENSNVGLGLSNFLPDFLIEQVVNKNSKSHKSDSNPQNKQVEGNIFYDANEDDDIQFYMDQLSFKENLFQKSNQEKLKVPRGKYNSTGELKQYAKEYKQRVSASIQNQIQNSKLNINYNINQNINQNINPSPSVLNKMYPNLNPYSKNSPLTMRKTPSSDFDLPLSTMHTNNPPNTSNFYNSFNSCSSVSSVGSFNSLEGSMFNIHPTPKRTHSSGNIDISKPRQPKGSLFFTEREDKCDEFESINELLDSLDMPLHLYAKSQKGSRSLQKLLNKIEPDGMDILLDKLKENLAELMIDTYGNYFCQKLIQCCSHDQRIKVLNYIMKDFTDIACNASGTHAIQSLIEIINMPGEEELVKKAVRDNILTLSYNTNGTHVIQKVISCIQEENREFINRTILNNLEKLVYDSNGICVVKKFINGNKDPAMRKFLLDKISSNTLETVQNAYGNYVIQHILDEWGPTVAKDIIDVIINNIISLSMQKFSSNVVEKCFDIVDSTFRKRIITELFNAGKISSLLKNKYGNFVLQKAIQTMTIEEKKEVKEYLGKRVGLTSNKEKSRLINLIDII